jgi:hypothetical protein
MFIDLAESTTILKFKRSIHDAEVGSITRKYGSSTSPRYPGLQQQAKNDA